MNNPRIEIKTKGDGESLFTEIYVDGHKLRGVRSFRLERKVGNSVPTLTVDLNALNIAVDQYVILKHDGYGEIDIKFKE